MTNDNQVNSVYPDQGALNDILIGRNLEENLFKLQYLLSVLQQALTPEKYEVPMRLSAFSGMEWMLEYGLRLVELELNRLNIK